MFKFYAFLLVFIVSLMGCEKTEKTVNQTPVNTPTPVNTSTPINPPTPISNNDNSTTFNLQSPVTLEGMGSIKTEMTIEEAEKATNLTLKKEQSGGEEGGCYYYSIVGINDILLMIIDNKIARIDIFNPVVTTKEGIKIGDTEAKVKQIYGNNIKEEPHHYVENGKYLILTLPNNFNPNYAIIFETDSNGKVTTFRTGRFPEVGYIEGCA